MSVFDDFAPGSWLQDGLVSAQKPKPAPGKSRVLRLGAWPVVAVSLAWSAGSAGEFVILVPPNGASGFEFDATKPSIEPRVETYDPADIVPAAYWDRVQAFMDEQRAVLPLELPGEDPDPIV